MPKALPMNDTYARLLEFTRDGLCRYTVDAGRVLMCNQGFLDILDLDGSPEDYVGKRLRELQVYTQQEGTIRKHLEAHGEIHGFEHRFKTLKGDEKWVLHDSIVIVDPATGERIVEAIIQDMTYRKRQEESDQETVRLQAVGSLARGMSQNFSNLLSLIQGYASTIADHLIPGTRAHTDARHILDATRHALDLTQKLVNVARASDGDLAHPAHAVALATVVRNTVDLVENSFSEKGIQVDIHQADAMPFANADNGQLLDVLMNVLLSSSRAMPRGGAITIETTARAVRRPNRKGNPQAKPGMYAVLSVRDTGEGMSEDILEHLFAPLFSKEDSLDGLGLGLALSQGVVRGWGGWIEARRPTGGKGATFRVFLPLAQAPGEDDATAPGKDLTILVVDDDPAELTAMQEVLAGHDHRVHTAREAGLAAASFREHADEIDVVVIDLMLAAGDRLLESILKIRPETRVVVTSGFSRDFARHRIPRGAWRFLQKPFDPDQLLGAIQAAL